MNNINSDENKELLWDLMYRNKMFNNLTDEHISNIKDIFDKNIKNISLEKHDKSMTQLNKLIISTLVKKIKKHKENLEYSIQSKDKKTQNVMQNKVKSKEEEFNKLMNIKKPNNIDFTLKNDKPFGKEINNILDNTIKKRSYDLYNVINHDYNVDKAKEWLKNGGSQTLNSGNISQWNDDSGNNNHATQSSASFQPNADGGGAEFDGTDDRFDLTSNIVLNAYHIFIVLSREQDIIF